MILYFCIALNIWCLMVLLLRSCWSCLFPLPWSVLITVTFVSMFLTFLVHAHSWRCWSYLRYRPRRLRSMSRIPPQQPFILLTVFIVLELCCLTLSLWLWFHSCDIPQWSGLIVFVVILIVHTACLSPTRFSPESSESPESPESSESSNVNTSEEDVLEDSSSDP